MLLTRAQFSLVFLDCVIVKCPDVSEEPPAFLFRTIKLHFLDAPVMGEIFMCNMGRPVALWKKPLLQ